MPKPESKRDMKITSFIVNAIAAKRNKDYDIAIKLLLEVVKDDTNKSEYRKKALLILGQCFILSEMYPGAKCVLEAGLKLAEMEKDELSIALYNAEFAKLAEKDKMVLINKITKKMLNGKTATA